MTDDTFFLVFENVFLNEWKWGTSFIFHRDLKERQKFQKKKKKNVSKDKFFKPLIPFNKRENATQ